MRAYASLEVLKGHVENIDVSEDEYIAWDATGKVIGLSVDVNGISVFRKDSMDLTGLVAAMKEYADLKKVKLEPDPPTDTHLALATWALILVKAKGVTGG